jgi:predicted outer membrane protein
MGIRFLAPAAIVSLLLNTTASLAPAAAQTAAQHLALASDSNFSQMAMSLGLLQVKLGKLAQDRVRDFGKRVVADYSRLNEQLVAGARQAAYPHPVLLRQHQQIFDRLNRIGRSSFDKNYMAEMVSRHEEVARLFEEEAKNGRVQSLKLLAASLLPDVQQDQSLAAEAAGSVDADVTASASSEQ